MYRERRRLSLCQGELDHKILAIDVSDPLAARLSSAADLETLLPGTLPKLLEWLKMYKTTDGKAVNALASDVPSSAAKAQQVTTWPIQHIVLFMGFCARINTIICAPTLCFGTPPSPPSVHTIVHYNVPHRPPVIAIYTTQYWSWQYRVKAKCRMQLSTIRRICCGSPPLACVFWVFRLCFPVSRLYLPCIPVSIYF